MRGRGPRCCSCYIPELWAHNPFSLASSFNKSEERVSWGNTWNKTKKCCWFSLLRKKMRSELSSPEGEMNWGEIFSWDLPVGILWWILSALILSIFQNGLNWESHCCPWKRGEEKMDWIESCLLKSVLLLGPWRRREIGCFPRAKELADSESH